MAARCEDQALGLQSYFSLVLVSSFPPISLSLLSMCTRALSFALAQDVARFDIGQYWPVPDVFYSPVALNLFGADPPLCPCAATRQSCCCCDSRTNTKSKGSAGNSPSDPAGQYQCSEATTTATTTSECAVQSHQKKNNKKAFYFPLDGRLTGRAVYFVVDVRGGGAARYQRTGRDEVQRPTDF